MASGSGRRRLPGPRTGSPVRIRWVSPGLSEQPDLGPGSRRHHPGPGPPSPSSLSRRAARRRRQRCWPRPEAARRPGRCPRVGGMTARAVARASASAAVPATTVALETPSKGRPVKGDRRWESFRLLTGRSRSPVLLVATAPSFTRTTSSRPPPSRSRAGSLTPTRHPASVGACPQQRRSPPMSSINPCSPGTALRAAAIAESMTYPLAKPSRAKVRPAGLVTRRVAPSSVTGCRARTRAACRVAGTGPCSAVLPVSCQRRTTSPRRSSKAPLVTARKRVAIAMTSYSSGDTVSGPSASLRAARPLSRRQPLRSPSSLPISARTTCRASLAVKGCRATTSMSRDVPRTWSAWKRHGDASAAAKRARVLAAVCRNIGAALSAGFVCGRRDRCLSGELPHPPRQVAFGSALAERRQLPPLRRFLAGAAAALAPACRWIEAADVDAGRPHGHGGYSGWDAPADGPEQAGEPGTCVRQVSGSRKAFRAGTGMRDSPAPRRTLTGIRLRRPAPPPVQAQAVPCRWPAAGDVPSSG